MEEVIMVMRKVVTPYHRAQLYNPDPFALPVWRAPVYQTPAGIILAAWLARLVIRLVRLACRHPVVTAVLALLAFLGLTLGWIGVAALAGWAVLVPVIWWHYWPVAFGRWVSGPARGTWRAWAYRRKWAPVMTIAGLAPFYRGRIILPVLSKVTATRYVDRVQVRLVSGQSAADFADRATTWPTVSGPCCAGSARLAPGRWCWSSSAATPWPLSSPPCPSRTGRTSQRCRLAAGKTGCPG
jgi:hypothetical protein